MDKILIKGLKINAIIGILQHEREYEQPLELDITMQHDLHECALSGDLSESINYAEVCKKVTAFVIERKAELIETLAEDICTMILNEFKPHSVQLRILKTHAVTNTQGVGVEIMRTRKD